jgi:hypothetical protein
MDPIIKDRFEKINAGSASKEFVKETIIQRYPLTNEHLVRQLRFNPKMEKLYEMFCYQRGVPVFLKDGSTEMKYASNMMIGPSVAIQILENVEIDSRSSVLELFCGAGYFTLFLSIMTPKLLVCADKFTVNKYDLPRTFDNGLNYVFGKKIPQHTVPIWFLLDATKDKPKENYCFDRIFLHPPFGKALTKFSPNLTDNDAIKIWLSSVDNAKKMLKDSKSLIISIVPADWAEALKIHLSNTATNKIIPLAEIQQFPTNIIITRFSD